MENRTGTAAARFCARRIQWHPDGGFAEPLPTDLDSPRTLVVAFADRGLDAADGPVGGLTRAFPRSIVLACSSAGEIADEVAELGGLSGVVMRFATGTLRWARASIEGRAARDVGRELAAALTGEDLKGVFVVSDGLAVNGSELARGLGDGLPAHVGVAGGLAGDGDRFGATWVAAGASPGDGTVAAVGFYGENVEIGVGSDGGWAPFGPGRRVTRSEGNVLYELDGEPAVPLYRDYLGDYAAQLPGSALLFPLSVRARGMEGAVVRTILAIDEDAGSMTFAGDVDEDAVAHLMTSTGEQLCQAAATLPPDRGQVVAIAVSCVGRRLAMGQRIDDELAAAREALPEDAVHVGFYSYGEIGPGEGGACVLHNQTMTILSITERDGA